MLGFLFDTKNAQTPQILGKQYSDAASEENVRQIAHHFADEIILRLGGGLNGISETKIYFVSNRTGTKEIWAMDYDGQGAACGHAPGLDLPLAPRLAGQLAHRLLFAGQRRLVHPHVFAGAGTAWSAFQSSGRNHAFSRLVERWQQSLPSLPVSTGDNEIYITDASGGGPAPRNVFSRAGCLARVES